MSDSPQANLYISSGWPRSILCGRYADIFFADWGTVDGFCVSMGNRGPVLPTGTIGATCVATHATLPTRLMHMPTSSSAVALPICPPRKQQPGHIVRGLPTPAYLSSGEDAADDHMLTPSYLLLPYTSLPCASVYKMMRGPFSPGSLCPLQLVAGLLLVYGSDYCDESQMTSCGLELHGLSSTEIAL